MSERSSFIKDFVSVSLGNYGGIVLSFTLNVILAWRLGTEQFGRLALLIMVVQVLAGLVANWTMTGLIQFSAQEFARTGSVAETFWARLSVIAPWLTGAGLALAIGQEPVASYLNVPIWGVWLVFLYFLLSSLVVTLGAVFQACQRMDRYAVALFLDKAVAVAAVLLLPAPYAEDAVLIIACYAVSSLVVCVWAVTVLGSRILLPVRTGRETVVGLWKFSAPLIISTWVGLVSTQWIQYVIIKQYLPLSEIGLYSLANQVAGMVQQVTIISSALLLPRFSMLVANRQHDEIRTMIEKLVPYGFMGFALFLSAGVLLAGTGVPLIFGSAFAGAVPPLGILLVATMALALFNTFMPLISAYGDTWSLSRITLVSALVNLAGALLLIPLLGINGAAVATLLGHGTAAAMMLRRVQSRLGFPALRLAAMGLPVVLMVTFAGSLEGGPFYLVGVAMMVLSSIALGRAFKLFDQEALRQLMRLDMPMFIKSGLKVLSEKTG